MKIAYKPADRQGVGSYRVLFPMRELARQFGWECEPFREHTRTIPDGRTARFFDVSELPLDADLIVLQREMNLAMVDRIHEWQDQGRRVIMDLDDDHSKLATSNPAWKSSHPDPRVRAAHLGIPLDDAVTQMTALVNRDNIRDIVAAVDAITVSTPALATAYGGRNRNVIRLSNALDWEMWEHVKPHRSDRLRIGYMGVSAWHMEDLNQLRGVVGPFLRKHPDIDFVAAGDHAVHDILEVPEQQRVSFPACAFGEHVEMTASMDIALVPLAPGVFNLAKSCLKGMEANAAWVPFIASPTLPYLEYVKNGGGGLTANRGHDWTTALNTLVNDHELRARLSLQGRRIAGLMTIQQHAARWRDNYEWVVGGSRTTVAGEAHPGSPQAVVEAAENASSPL